MTVRLIAITGGAAELMGKTAQQVLSYTARVSNPDNQLNFGTAAKLLQYCLLHDHWSVFEHAYMTLEIETSRAVAAQILRHRSFTFQEFSQRYADPTLLPENLPKMRRQDSKNRQSSIQSSIDDFSPAEKSDMENEIRTYFEGGLRLYKRLIDRGVSRESARFVLPLAHPTRLYMTGNARSWIHYVQLRTGNGTQLEHVMVAQAVKTIFSEQFPDIALALGWR
jgi:thymidylate synthase (FAD)